MCMVRTPARWRESAPPMCMRHELSAEAHTSAPVSRIVRTLSVSIAIEVSGMFGSRQEEAQRLGRILRPKHPDNRAWFYALVSHETCEQDYARKRQRFLATQGYGYAITTAAELTDRPFRGSLRPVRDAA